MRPISVKSYLTQTTEDVGTMNSIWPKHNAANASEQKTLRLLVTSAQPFSR